MRTHWQRSLWWLFDRIVCMIGTHFTARSHLYSLLTDSSILRVIVYPGVQAGNTQLVFNFYFSLQIVRYVSSLRVIHMLFFSSIGCKESEIKGALLNLLCFVNPYPSIP